MPLAGSCRAIRSTSPFDRREIYRPDDVERKTELYSDRYSAHIALQPVLRPLQDEGLDRQFPLGHLGWRAVSLSAAGLPRFGVRALWTIAQLDTNSVNVEVDLCATDRGLFEPLGPPHAPRVVPIPTTDVPSVVFSEMLRDLDLFVTVCTIANDLIWLDMMSGERRLAEYWERVAADGLGTTLGLRRRAS